MNKKQLNAPTPHTDMRSLHPNHVHLVDVSTCIQYYLDDGGMKIMRQDEFYKNKFENFKKVKTPLGLPETKKAKKVEAEHGADNSEPVQIRLTDTQQMVIAPFMEILITGEWLTEVRSGKGATAADGMAGETFPLALNDGLASRTVACDAVAGRLTGGCHGAKVADDERGLIVCVGGWRHGCSGDAFLDNLEQIRVGLGAAKTIGGEIDACDLVAVGAMAVGATGEVEQAAALNFGGG